MKNEDVISSNLDMIKNMAEEGSTDKEIASALNIPYSSYKRYKKENSELKEVLTEAKDKKNQEVEKALYKCCIGYKYYEEVATKVKEEVLADDGVTVLTKESVVVSNVKKYKGPDLSAQKYWLNNKKKAVWKDDPHKVANDNKLTKLKEKELNNKTKLINELGDD